MDSTSDIDKFINEKVTPAATELGKVISGLAVAAYQLGIQHGRELDVNDAYGSNVLDGNGDLYQLLADGTIEYNHMQTQFKGKEMFLHEGVAYFISLNGSCFRIAHGVTGRVDDPRSE